MATAKTPRNRASQRKKTVPASPRVAPPREQSAPPTNGLENEIRIRAYELYERRGYEPGHEDEDWLTAEREVAARHSPQPV
jgi:Protein of unknown function (DUF2934)